MAMEIAEKNCFAINPARSKSKSGSGADYQVAPPEKTLNL